MTPPGILSWLNMNFGRSLGRVDQAFCEAYTCTQVAYKKRPSSYMPLVQYYIFGRMTADMGYRFIPYLRIIFMLAFIDKQCGPRTDDVTCGVGSSSTRFELNNFKNKKKKKKKKKKNIVIIKANQTPLLLEKDLTK